MSNAEKIQMAMNTIGVLNIPATIENVSRLAGVYGILQEVRNDLAASEKPQEGKEDAGAAEAK